MATKKDLGLEGLRGIASCIVANGHFSFIFFYYLGSGFYNMPGVVPTYDFERWAVYPPFSFALCAVAAVSVFFVMSGYVLTTGYFVKGEIEPVQSAASRRYIRLVLPSCASVLFAWYLWKTGAIIAAESIPIGVAGWVSTWYVTPFTFLGAIRNGLIDGPLFSVTDLNPPLWSIQFEMLGSILLYAMLALFGKRPLLLLGWFLVFAVTLTNAPNSLYYLSFLAGAMINPMRDWLKSHQAVSILLAVVGLVGVAYAPYSSLFAPMQAIPLPNFSPTGPNFNSDHQMFWNTIGAILLVAGTIGSGVINRALGSRILVFLGKISFSIYLVHMPLIMSVGLRTSRYCQKLGYTYETSAFIAYGVFVVTTLLTATFFQRYIDAPSIRLAAVISKRDWSGRKKLAP